MKRRTRILMVTCLLLAVAGAWLFWPQGNRPAPTPQGGMGIVASGSPTLASTAPAERAGAAATSSALPTLNTNKLTYRLANTTASLGQLQANPHALLLENALIDSDKPLNLNIPAHLRAAGDPGTYIVQAHGATDARFRAAVVAAGADIVSYIPNNAYRVRLSASGATTLAGNSLVQAVLPYEPYYKIQSTLLGLAVNQQPLPPGTALNLGVTTADAAAADQEIEKLGAKVIGHDRSAFGIVVRVLAPLDWSTVAQSPMVQFVEPAHSHVLANDLARVTVGISPDTISAMTNDYLGLHGQNVLVAVNDTGIDQDHPDFTATGTATAGPVGPTRIFGQFPIDLVDTNGHGTHVAGIIAGNGAESLGFGSNPLGPGPNPNVGTNAEGSVMNADFRGKAPLASLFSRRFENSDYDLQTNAWMVGALISNNSWDNGRGAAEYDLSASSYDAATRDALPFTTGSQPVLFVFAAGNAGEGNNDGAQGAADTILSPGTFKNGVTVGALEQFRDITNIVSTVTAGGTNSFITNKVAFWQNQTDSGNQVAWYSSRGNVGIGTEGTFGRFKPDVVSPGTFVVSTSSGFNKQWDTNAYYNPTNILQTVYIDQVASTNALVYYNVSVPATAVAVNISIFPNNFSPNPFPTNLPIYAVHFGIPATNHFDILTTKDGLSIPPDSNAGITIQSIRGNGFSFAVGDSTNFSVNYNMVVSVQTTNNVGDLYQVLQGMNDKLAPYYRYESGTSMAAASVAGVLALIQDYFTNQFTPAMIPSPALMKSVLINGSRSVADYGLALTNGINFQGWGLENIQNCVPAGGLFNLTDGSTEGSSFFAEQNPATALATGDQHTFIVTLDTSTFAQFLQLQATLVWTDPPGDPAAAIKLVNNLDLVMTNLDTGEVYFGNDISGDFGFNLPWDTNSPPNLDSINNVENILLPPMLAGKYSVTVVGRSVNVNAVTAQTNNAAGQYAPNVVQDYALVISVGEGEIDNVFNVTDSGVVSNPTGGQNVTVITTTNSPLFNQIAGENSPLLGTNTLPLGNNTIWGPNGVVTIGQTNQWHFYLVTNTGPAADFTNAAFITFESSTLSIPRMGVLDPLGMPDATRPEADIDLYVSQDPGLTNLSPVAISNCLVGVGSGFGVGNAGASLTQGGTEFVFFTNSAPGQVYYIGVKSEDREGAEYAFLPVFTDVPFSSLDQNGNQIVHGLLVPVNIPDGNNAHPGVTNVFALAVLPMVVEKVTVTNLNQHQNFGDLFGALTFGSQHVVLNNHDGFGNTLNSLTPIVYDDSRNRTFGTTNTDGPGSLVDFRRKSALGPWILGEQDNSLTQTGRVSIFDLIIQPHRDLKQPGIIVSVPPGGWFIDFVDVPPGYTNLTFFGTNVTIPAPATPPIQMYEKFGNDPTLTDYDQRADLTNGTPPGNLISVGPPLPQGQYFIGLFNPNTSIAQNVFISATLGVDQSVNDIFTYTTNSTALIDDAVANASIFITATQAVASVNVSMVVDHPRISDLTFTLVSPTGQRVLLMENRGAGSTNAGFINVITNFFGTQSAGSFLGGTNIIGPIKTSGTLIVDYDFRNQPDNMDVFYDGVNIFHSGLVNLTGTFTIPYGPGLSTNIVIVMDGPGSGVVEDGSLWFYTPRVVQEDFNYLTFTDDTNLAQVPIKFANPPFEIHDSGTNFSFSDFDLATNGDYHGLTNIYDGFGGWTVPTNMVTITTIVTNGQFVQVTNVVLLSNNLVSVMPDVRTAQSGTNYLALADGTITRTLPFTIGRKYQVTYAYRGPGISGWWRGEGNATDSSTGETNGNNGTLIGRFNYPGGVVGQAFQFEDPGNQFQFAATNTYIQVPASATLNVGTNGGFTIEGWINPTNLSRPQPLFEWLARVPTNTAVTNVVVLQGPMLNPATGHFYYLLAATNWQTSEIWATNLGGHLVTIETANEENWVYDTFTAYGTLNRNLWTGLGYTNTTGKFAWSSGFTNLPYTNWAPAQPFTCGANNDQFYVAIMGATNAYPGLWQLEDNLGLTCDNPPTNPIYGVVEVIAIPTNGVQFWISGTNNTPGNTNVLAGCLYANIVDTNFLSHEIFSLPGLLTSNTYQHVAVTYNTNTGIAALYLNGTNVATTNLGVFVPKTDGDLLIGWDMTHYTNNFYSGKMDEMSLYSRALSLAEISSIYNISVPSTNGTGNTNGLIGKFDPTIFAPLSLAKFQVSLGGTTRTLYGDNARWLLDGFTFIAQTNSLPMQFTGLEPGVLLDSMSISEFALGNVYYLPEQALAALNGSSAFGNWTLQVWDNRAGAFLTNLTQVVTWQLSFTLVSNAVVSASLPPLTPVATTVPVGQIVYYSVTVPAWAHVATNIVVSSDQPVNLYFNQTTLPNGSNPNDSTLFGAPVTSGSGFPSLQTNAAPPLLPLLTNRTYFLGVQNFGNHAANVKLEVDYDILALTNGVPFDSVLNTNEYDQVRYFSYDVGSNAYEATFQLLKLTGNADLVLRKGVPLPDLTSSDYGSFNSSIFEENIYVVTNSAPVPLSPGRWYLGVFKRDSGFLGYSVLAKELDLTNGSPNILDSVTVIPLTNSVPFSWTAGPGAALTNFFRFHPTNSVVNGTNFYVQSLRFELYNESGNGDLTVQTNFPPLAPPFFQTSQNRGREPELIFVYTNNVMTNLATDWYLGVPNLENTNISYTIVAVAQTNGYFPAFPGAVGAGGGAIGAGHAGTISSVYHVTTTDDSGPGSLRDAIAATNRTVVFDLAGSIFLNSPLLVTNSNLTIAGQTSPGGISLVGQTMTVASAHDVVIRDIRIRAAGLLSPQTNSFEGAQSTNYTAGQTAAGWKILANQASVVTDPSAAYPGHTNFLTLASGAISNNIPTQAGRTYQMSFAFRGPGIVAWWRGETNALDTIGGNNATLENGTGFAASEVGAGFNFSGTDKFMVANSAAPSGLNVGADGLTFEQWVKPNTVSPLEQVFFQYERVLGGGGPDTGVNFAIHNHGSGAFFDANLVDTSSVSHIFDSTAGLINAGVWQHVALTYDKASGTATYYLNGINITTTNFGSFTLQTSYTYLPIGARTSFGSVSSPNAPFSGLQDEISLYNRALSASEIKAIYAKGTAGKFDPAVFATNSPAQSLAEATFAIPGVITNTYLGSNTNWQKQTFLFVATGANTPLVISGVAPGLLMDSVVVAATSDLGGSLLFNTASNVIADHISASWSTNEEMSVLNSTNLTVQWSIMADTLYNTNYFLSGDPDDDIAVSNTNVPDIGSVVRQGAGPLSFYRNLYADNAGGSLRLGDNLTVDFVNNVVYNWSLWPVWTGGTTDMDLSPGGSTNTLNFVCNYLIAGPDTAAVDVDGESFTNLAYFGNLTNALAANWIFQTNNFIDSDTNRILNGANTGWNMFDGAYTRFGRPFNTPAVPVDEAFQAYEKVLDFSGVSLVLRDDVDTNIVTKVRYQNGTLIRTGGTLPVLISALPYLDTDQDGIPDFFENTFTPGLVFVPSNNNDRDGDSYTDLEEYNNWLAGPRALTVTNTPVGVDLYKICGNSGHLAFFLDSTNQIHGLAYFTNGVVNTNSSLWTNSIVTFMPTNSAGSGTNYYGYASFSFFVTNLDTSAYFGPVPVSVLVGARPVQSNSNFPPVIVDLTSGVADPTNFGGSQFYHILITTNDYGALFELDNPTGPMALVVKKGLPLPSLSDYHYYTNAPPPPANLEVAVFTNSTPVPLAPGDWYMGAVNVAGSNVVYDAKITVLHNLLVPVFSYPTNTTVTNIIETVPWSVGLVATDPDTPSLPLSFAVVSGPGGLTITNSTIYWTPIEAQGPSTNTVQVSVSNGAFAVTNSFVIIVQESNLPPVLPFIPSRFVIVPNRIVVTNAATDPDIPTNAIGYTLTSTVTGANQPIIGGNGVIRWRPLPIQAETNYLFTTVATDTNPWAVNAQSLSATNTFSIFVFRFFPPNISDTNVIPPNTIRWFPVVVPPNAIIATNNLIFATGPLNMWFTTNVPPATNYGLLGNVTSGISILTTNLATAPTNIVPGNVYFLGLQNANPFPVTNALRVDFAFAPPPLLSLPFIPDQYIAAGDTLIVTNTATDTNASAILSYVLASSPAGATITTNGIITWVTTTNMPVPANFLFTTVVTDVGANVKATNNFFVTVLPLIIDDQPLTNIVDPFGINWFLVSVPTNADFATNILLFATGPLNFWYSTNVPPSIDDFTDVELLTNSTGGSRVIDTVSTPRLVPGKRYFLAVQNPNNFAVTNAVKVKFHLVLPQPPSFVIFSITQTNLSGTAGFLLTWFAPASDQFHLQWTPALAPLNWASFNGVISDNLFITATNSQFQYFDDGSQTGGFGPTRFYRLLLLDSPTNTAPFFVNTPTVFYAPPSVPFVYTNAARDWDVPAQALSYSVTNTLAGTNVTINPSTGVITWTPDISLLNQTNFITTGVIDNGIPALGVTNTFAVVVSTNAAAPAVPPFSSVSILTNGVKFQWIAPTNEQFKIQWTTNLAPMNWHMFPDILTSTTGSFSFVDTNTPLLLMKFYELILLP